jgi:hypothetical protein
MSKNDFLKKVLKKSEKMLILTESITKITKSKKSPYHNIFRKNWTKKMSGNIWQW